MLIAFESHIGELYLDNQLPFLFHLSGGNEDELIELSNPLEVDEAEEEDDELSGIKALLDGLGDGGGANERV